MKTIIIYFSLSGNTKELAVKKSGELGADIEEITAVKKPSVIKAFVIGSFRAIKRKKANIQPIKADLSNYEKIIIMCPVWASHPAPPFNNIVEHLPSGKKVELIMVSAGGGTKKTSEKTKALITSRGCEVTEYTDIKA
jgi:flavodoxin